MKYEAVLETMLGAVGSAVSVGILGTVPEGMEPPMVAQLRGTLSGGIEVDEEEGDVFALGFDEYPGAIFMLDRRAFAGAGWTDPAQTALLVQVGSVGLLIDLDP